MYELPPLIFHAVEDTNSNNPSFNHYSLFYKSHCFSLFFYLRKIIEIFTINEKIFIIKMFGFASIFILILIIIEIERFLIINQ